MVTTSNEAVVRGGPPAGISVAGEWPESAASASMYAVPALFLWLTDFLALGVALILAWRLAPAIQHQFAVDTGRLVPSWLSGPPSYAATGLRPFTEILWIAAVMVPATLLFVQVFGGYRQLLEQSRTRVVASTIMAPLVGVSLVALVLIAVRNENTSRALIFSFALFSAAELLGYRWALRFYKRRRMLAGQYARNIVLIGPSAARMRLSRHLARNVSSNIYRLCGYLETAFASGLPEAVTASRDTDQGAGDSLSLPYLGPVDELGDLLIHRPIHEVIVVQSAGSEDWLPHVIEQCEYFRVTVRLVSDALLSWQSRDLSVMFGGDALRLPEIILRPRYLDDGAMFVKRLFDVVTSSILLVLLSPLLLLIAVTIKLTTPSLPVLYPWRVVGYKGRAFTGYKFTTMEADADARKGDLMHLNEMSGPVFKIKDDPRITPIGRFLRKYSLNELPQLWSVLKGDMSLVGPRPAGPHELARYELWHKRKLCVQPGITCLWQIRGRNRISNFDDWVRMDLEYIDNWSLWLDLRILIRTAATVLAGTGA